MDILEQRPCISDRDIAALREAAEAGWVSQRGPVVDRFEDELAAFLGMEAVLATDSGTASLHLALAANGVGPGDTVLVPDFTYGATATAVLALGAIPVPVDIEPETYGMDPLQVEEAVTAETAAILCAHMFGRPARLDALQEVAERHAIPLIEDAAQAFGATFRGNAVGGVGAAGCFSFSWSKLLTTAKGGAVATDDPGAAEAMRELADYGRATGERATFVRPGYNYRMDSLRAAIGRAQLDRVEETVEERRSLFAAYRDGLEPCPVDAAVLADDRETTVSPYAFIIRTEERDGLRDHLAGHGIRTRAPYRPVHTMPAVDAAGEYPVATRVAGSVLALPAHTGMERADVERVCGAVHAFYEGGGR